MYAHLNKELHKAFSVFIHDGNGNMLIQKRSSDKYHSGGLWTNACCSHPLTDDIYLEAQFRMQQELGFSSDIEFVDKFVYFTDFPGGVFEYELDYVYIGMHNSTLPIKYNSSEIDEVLWIPIDSLLNDVMESPEKYTKWFITALYMVVCHMKRQAK